ncbi:MAG: hypothetical protein HPY90_08155 [Syntrophothermus sp.]|uniref:hypothetical protein n=1 Tax=Syntrophothermus sp. TaxID=2736299 RepID=UPI00257B0573|nr:hypothetical protein [Syntrophothermus sp.]NSW83235.1 hypothetical protein [Syntrophothermus sp.]
MVLILKWVSLVIWVVMVACLVFRPGAEKHGKRWGLGRRWLFSITGLLKRSYHRARYFKFATGYPRA